MIAKEEAPRTFYSGTNNTYYMHYKNVNDDCMADEFNSNDVTVSKKELIKILEPYNYFKP